MEEKDVVFANSEMDNDALNDVLGGTGGVRKTKCASCGKYITIAEYHTGVCPACGKNTKKKQSK